MFATNIESALLLFYSASLLDFPNSKIIHYSSRIESLTIYSQETALVLMGALLMATVLFVPRGFVLGIGELLARLGRRRRRRHRPAATAEV